MKRKLFASSTPSEATMGDKSPKSKKRDKAQKSAAKALAKSKQEKRQQASTTRADTPVKK
jgi:hypothetical protein